MMAKLTAYALPPPEFVTVVMKRAPQWAFVRWEQYAEVIETVWRRSGKTTVVTVSVNLLGETPDYVAQMVVQHLRLDEW